MARSGTPVDAEALALRLLGRIAQDPERLGAFLAETGLSPATIRAATSEPGFLGAVLEHVSADENRLLALAAEESVAPETIAAARARLSPQPDWEP